MTDEQLFYAWLDGELDGAEAEKVAARVAADPVMAAEAERHRRLIGDLRAAFATVIETDLAAPRFGGDDVVDLKLRRDRRKSRPARFGVPQWAAIAATLVLGLVAGQMVDVADSAPIESRGGQLVAAAALEQALDHQLASADNDGPVRIGLTFRHKDGQLCRTFSGDPGSGLACRAGENWAIEGMFATPVGQSADYRMAAGENLGLATMIDQRIAGDPFDVQAERAALARGWR